ncbi:acyl--CoA ligase [Streptomyces sp. XM83C]|uniref:class I adenylate-forming enzyme family protein n=1 Tax=Streptomyces sp. XM83C TaxID=2929781 RepID=UPI001FF875EB|nr:class I adenylate-forming enzyme family protein [Streptomyces sp. XM83C]MCK1820276.1 acyl--CoA ligase [Streptomyces sp. XM83C]
MTETTLRGTAPRLTDGTGTLHGETLAGRITAAAREFHDRGLRPGDRVLVRGDNSTDYVVALLALMHLDTSLVPVDHRQTADEARLAAAQAGARWMLCDATAPGAFPADRMLHFTGAGSRAAPPAGARPDLAAWFARRDALVLWSSGTTGRPKGIVKSGRAVHDNTLRTIRAMGYRDDEVLAPLLPFSHQYGLSVILLWWLAGCTLVVTRYQRLDHALATAAGAGTTAVDAAPSTYHALLGLCRRRPELRAGLSGVRIWGVGGAPLPASLATSFAADMGLPLLDGYGLTELGNVALATPTSPVGCGRPLPGVDLRITGPDGTPLAPGETGEIEVRSPGLMEGYLDPDGTLHPVDRDTWFPTADLGRLDADGTVHVVGRNQAVHRLGFTLYPEGLARKAEGCGRQVKVLAVDDARRGCALHFVVEDPDELPPRHWRALLAALLADYEQPNAVHVVPAFPLTSNGKVDNHALRAALALPPEPR